MAKNIAELVSHKRSGTAVGLRTGNRGLAEEVLDGDLPFEVRVPGLEDESCVGNVARLTITNCANVIIKPTPGHQVEEKRTRF